MACRPTHRCRIAVGKETQLIKTKMRKIDEDKAIHIFMKMPNKKGANGDEIDVRVGYPIQCDDKMCDLPTPYDTV